MTALGTAVTRPVNARDPIDARLPRGPHVQMILIELAEQLACADLQARLKIAMLKARRFIARQPLNAPVKQVS